MISLTTSSAILPPPDPSLSPPRSFTTIFAPSLARYKQISLPIPLPAPVMMATLLFSLPIVYSF